MPEIAIYILYVYSSMIGGSVLFQRRFSAAVAVDRTRRVVRTRRGCSTTAARSRPVPTAAASSPPLPRPTPTRWVTSPPMTPSNWQPVVSLSLPPPLLSLPPFAVIGQKWTKNEQKQSGSWKAALFCHSPPPTTKVFESNFPWKLHQLN